MTALHVILMAALCFFGFRAFGGDWRTHETLMQNYHNKMESLEKEIQTLIQHKDHTSDPTVQKDLIAQIKTRHEELKKASADRNKEYLHMRFKHPEKGDLAERKYSRHEVKSIEDLEKDFTLDGRLDRLKQLVEQKFPLPESETQKAWKDKAAKRQPASEKSDETDSLVLRK